jgi:hypothetical protein
MLSSVLLRVSNFFFEQDISYVLREIPKERNDILSIYPTFTS